MKITKEEVVKVANLARLSFDENETEKFSGYLNQILDYMDKLNNLDTSNIDPTAHIIDFPTPLRDDKTEQLISNKEALKNAPEVQDGSIRVPKIIETEH